MFNKKGQEGMTLGTLLLIVLGVVVLVVLIVGFTGGFGFIFDKLDAAPGQQLQTIVKSCELSANNKLTVDYCGTLKKLDSDSYVSCEYTLVNNAIDSSISGQVTCTEGLRGSLVAACKDLEPSTTNVIKVNGVDVTSIKGCDAYEAKSNPDKVDVTNAAKMTCIEIKNAAGAAASWEANAAACTTKSGKDVTSQVTDDTGKGANTVCCLS